MGLRARPLAAFHGGKRRNACAPRWPPKKISELVDFVKPRSTSMWSRVHTRSRPCGIPAPNPKSEGEITMKFLSIYKARETGVPPTPQEMGKMERLIEEGMKSGYLLGGGPGAPLQWQADRDRRAFRGIQGGDRRLRPPSGKFQARGHRIGQAVPSSSWRR